MRDKKGKILFGLQASQLNQNFWQKIPQTSQLNQKSFQPSQLNQKGCCRDGADNVCWYCRALRLSVFLHFLQPKFLLFCQISDKIKEEDNIQNLTLCRLLLQTAKKSALDKWLWTFPNREACALKNGWISGEKNTFLRAQASLILFQFCIILQRRHRQCRAGNTVKPVCQFFHNFLLSNFDTILSDFMNLPLFVTRNFDGQICGTCVSVCSS